MHMSLEWCIMLYDKDQFDMWSPLTITILDNDDMLIDLDLHRDVFEVDLWVHDNGNY